MSDDPRPLLNKAELARVLKCSLPTLSQMLDRFGDDFPVVTRGGLGAAWEFDAAAVVAFLETRRRADAEAGRARDELIDQLTLPVQAEEDRGLSPADLLRLAQLRKLDRETQIAEGFLTETAKVRALLTDTLARLRRDAVTAITQTLADHHIPEATTRSILARVEDSQRQCVERLQALLRNGPADAPAESQPAFL